MGREIVTLGSIGVIAVSLMGFASCKALKERVFGSCPYNVEVCESACEEGVVGRGGCLDAGERHHAKVLSKDPSASMDKALLYFDKACAGGEYDGCRQQVELRVPQVGLLGAMATSDPDEARARLPELDVPPAVLAAREAPLREACQKKPKDNCLLLGRVLIGRDADGAREAFARACNADGSPVSCRDATTALEGAARFIGGCDSKDPRACHCLAEVVVVWDPFRAIPLWKTESLERYGKLDDTWLRETIAEAVSDHPPEGVDLWRGEPLIDPKSRWNPCKPGVDTPITPEQVEAFNRMAELVWGKSTVSGVPAEAVEELVLARRGPITRCFLEGFKDNPQLEGRVIAMFDIDRHGYAVNRHIGGSDLPDPRVIRCVLDELWRIRFPRPASEIGSVKLPLFLRNKHK